MKTLEELEEEFEVGDKERVLLEVRRIADSGNSEGMMVYASLLDDWADGDPLYSRDVISYFRNALERGESGAAFHLGSIYLEGAYVERDEEKAVNFFRIGADGGDAECMEAIGDLILEGENSKFNEAFSWYLSAVNAGGNCREKCMRVVVDGRLTGEEVEQFKVGVLGDAKRPLLLGGTIVAILLSIIIWLIIKS
ncbi:tetratricopeptide repeat protein [Microbulbifer discodermiae]|uniref:tetratricopeptide repeat protein n=1 Tax=Microbulbifer sp. 2201CG32-9 TaxID=3232309 RepID=UPI00345B8A1A